MIDPTKVFVSEFSYRQKCYHVHTLAEALIKNAKVVAHEYPIDYIPFAISDDALTANEICNRMKELKKNGGKYGFDDGYNILLP